jgi:hypothetical protein
MYDWKISCFFYKKIGHHLIGFHYTIHQKALCAKNRLMQYENIVKHVKKIVNFINTQALNKRKFKLLLEEVNPIRNGLVMYYNIRWFSRSRLLVECLYEIRLFLSDN